MDNQYPYTTTPEERAARRAQRIAARKERERARRRKLLLRTLPVLALLVAAVGLLIWALGKKDGGGAARAFDAQQKMESPAGPEEALAARPEPDPEPAQPYSAAATAGTALLGEELPSQYAIVIDLTNNAIVAQKDAYAVISPASMTKILTVLTAAEAIADESQLDDTVVIDFDITDYCYVNGCSVAGFLRDESVSVRDLFYGTILPSGADAALGLAKYISGSQEAFVALMNQKAEELGLSDTAHFSNCVGIYDEENVCTVYDMAMILKAAMDNELCREVLTTKVYEIPASEAHPEGMVLSNWFLRRIEDHMPSGVEILGAKTGFVNESGSCAASCAQNAEGNVYLCVTGNAYSSWRCIKDHAMLYELYAGGEAA